MSKPNLPGVLFAVLVIVGIVAAVFVQRYAVLGTVADSQSVPLSNSQDKLLAQRNDLSKWLLGLAYTTLVGLLGLQIKDESRRRPGESSLSMAAAALLVVSIFAAFLFQEATTHALEADIRLLYGSYLEAPLQIQFYTLLVALVLLAIWLFRPARQLSLFAILVALVLPGAAQNVRPSTECVKQWADDREVVLSQDLQLRVARLIGRIRTRAEAKLGSGDECAHVASVADQIRWLAREKAGITTDRLLPQAITELEEQSGSPNALPSDWISQLIESSKLWRPVPYSQLSIKSTPEGLQVRLKGNKVGLTNWLGRVQPGDYRLELLDNDVVVYSEILRLVDKSERAVQYPKP